MTKKDNKKKHEKLLTPVFSEKDYNRGFKEFSASEVNIRANCILDATTKLLEIYNDDPESPEGLLSAGKLNEIEGDTPFAIRWYERAVGADPTLYEAQARLAVVQMKAERYEEAVEIATRLVTEAPDYVMPALVRRRPISAWSVLGDALRLVKNEDAALSAYSKAFEVEPRDMYAAGHKGVILLNKGRFDEALEALEKVDQANGVFGPIRAAARLGANDPDLLVSIRDGYIRSQFVGSDLA